MVDQAADGSTHVFVARKLKNDPVLERIKICFFECLFLNVILRTCESLKFFFE